MLTDLYGSDKYFNIDEDKTLNFLKENTTKYKGKTINKKHEKLYQQLLLSMYGEMQPSLINYLITVKKIR